MTTIDVSPDTNPLPPSSASGAGGSPADAEPASPSCCAPAEAAQCCEPSAKAGCCGTTAAEAVAAPPTRCGCR